MGIAGDVRQMGLDAPVKAEMYFPYSQISDQPWFAPRDLVVRTAAEPMSLVPAIKQAIRAVDPEQAVSNIRTFDEVLDEEVVQRRLGTALVAAFAALALLLASLGVYGVLSYFVTQHTAEIGVRLALGASRGDILRLVLGKGMALALSGAGLGDGRCAAAPSPMMQVSTTMKAVRFIQPYFSALRGADGHAN